MRLLLLTLPSLLLLGCGADCAGPGRTASRTEIRSGTLERPADPAPTRGGEPGPRLDPAGRTVGRPDHQAGPGDEKFGRDEADAAIVALGLLIGYKLFYCTLTVVGVTLDFTQLIDFSDAIYFLMAVPNVIGLYLLAPVVRREMLSYFARLKSGEIRNTRVAPEAPVGSA